MCLHRLGERPVRRVFTVGQAAAFEHRRVRQQRHELREQARLAHPGRPQKRDHLRRAFSHGATDDGGQDRQLVGPRDQRAPPRNAAWRGLGRDGLRRPGDDRLALAFRVDPPFGAVRDGARSGAAGSRADEHLPRIGGLLQARGDVDRVAADHQLTARGGLASRDDLAGVDADAEADVDAVAVGDRRGEA